MSSPSTKTVYNPVIVPRLAEVPARSSNLGRRLKTEGRGESELLYDGDTETEHMLNRRVKVTLIEND